MNLSQDLLGSAKSLYSFIKRRSWFLNVIGTVSIAVGGVIANATAGAIFHNACMTEGDFCIAGVRKFFLHSYEGYLILCGTTLAIAGAFLSYSDKNEIDRLREDLGNQSKSIRALEQLNNEMEASRVDVRSVIAIFLQRLYEEMSFSSTERISAYLVREKKFFIIGRYYKNPDYHRIHRDYYPINQ